MKPESKVVTLKTAQRLREAGFPQDTERMYLMIPHVENGKIVKHGELLDPVTTAIRRYDIHIPYDDKIAAPDATEIGQLLPQYVPYMGRHLWISTDATSRDGVPTMLGTVLKEPKWECSIAYIGADQEHKCVYLDRDDNEAEARAAAFLWLKEKKLI